MAGSSEISVAAPLAVITGGASGIGAACARRLASDGFAVLVCDRDLERARAVARECGQAARAVLVDVSDEESVAALMASVRGTPGRLTAAVNCAAIPDDGGPAAECEFSSWRRSMSVNLDGVFLCIRAELREMLPAGGGAIVTIGSVLGLRGHPAVPAYVTAKHAIIGLHRSVAQAYSAQGVRANVVCPGYISTPMLERRTAPGDVAALAALHPAGRLGTVEEVAGLVAWLAGPSSSFVSGAVYTVDGGFTA